MRSSLNRRERREEREKNFREREKREELEKESRERNRGLQREIKK